MTLPPPTSAGQAGRLSRLAGSATVTLTLCTGFSAPVWAQTAAPEQLSGSMQTSNCPAPTTTGDVQAALELAEAAYAQADLSGLETAQSLALTALPCVSDRASRALVARFHRTMGLASFVEGDSDRAERAFAAGRRLEPGYSFPVDVVPEGNPVLDEYAKLPVNGGLTLLLDPEPAEGRLLLDGRTETSRSASWPTVAQVIDDTGSVQTTAWVWPDQDLPAYTSRAQLELAHSTDTLTLASTTGAPEVSRAQRQARRRPWLVATAATAATTVTLFAVSRSASHAYWDPAQTDPLRLDQLRSTTNNTLYAAASTAAVTLGLGVVTLTF